MSLSVKTQGGGGGGGMYASIFATGVSETDTVTLTTPKGLVKSGKWKVRGARLPEEYQEVEYIKCTGTQYANTRITQQLPIQIEVGFSLDVLNERQIATGGIYGGNDTRGYMIQVDAPNNSIICGINNSAVTSIIAELNTKYDVSLDAKSGAQTLVVNGNTFAGSITASWSTTRTYYLMAASDNDASATAFAYVKGNLYYARYRNGYGTLLRDYVPCYIKSTGEGGLYDLVSNTFFGNDGTGEFIVGPDVVHAGFLFEKLSELGTYMLTADDGEKTAYEEILVDMSTEYQVEVSYVLWLYREGDECEDITGGWGTDGWTTSESGWAISASATKNSDNLYLKAPTTNRYCVGAMTNPVNLTGYSKLCMDVYTGSAAWALELLVTSRKDYNGENGFLYEDKSAATRAVVMADISSINQEAYIAFASGGNNTDRWAYIYNIWLE